MTNSLSLSQLGWAPFFQQQLSLEEWEQYTPARVFEQHRAHFDLVTEHGEKMLPVTSSMPELTVGDWILLDNQGRLYRVLDRLSLFSRKAAGTKVATQLIAANIDTVFIVSSMNQDFSVNRIERYLALARDTGVEPVVVLTKIDLCDDPSVYIRDLQQIDPSLAIEGINALDPASVKTLEPWCSTGKTIALLGSSGVGKSTLVNTLLGQSRQTTAAIRDDDSKGRHTTTARSLHLMPSGGLLLDTPGMREIQLSGCEDGIDKTFADITELANRCRFADCQHQNEPGCAVREAIASGALDARRLLSYQKLLREQALNSISLAEKRARDRSQGRYFRSIKAEIQRRKNNE